ncbi:MAG: hypothetical protein U0893_22025 [Chloroflexota bacterium]
MAIIQRTEDWASAVPAHLLLALEDGELSQTQLRQLIGIEAEALGLAFDDAVTLARARQLPRTAVSTDLELLVELLEG